MPVAEALAADEQGTENKERRAGNAALKIDPILVPYDPLADRAALVQLAGWCQQFSPTVGLEEAEAPDSLLLDITGLGRLFGGEDRLAEQVRQAFLQRGLAARLAIADTVGAAWAAAHYGSADHLQSKIQNPNSKIHLVPSGESCTALAPLPVVALRLPAETAGLLSALGIERIGQLQSLPRESLAARFGQRLAERLLQATGGLAEVIVSQQPPPLVAAAWPFEAPTERYDLLEAALGTLTEQVVNQLERCGRGVVRLECRLYRQAGSPLPFSVGLYRPTLSARHLLELLQLQLEGISLGEPVSGVRIEVTAALPLERRQQELFPAGPDREGPRHLAALIDRLSNRLGREAVLRAVLSPDAQPEFACRYEPLVGAGTAGEVSPLSGIVPRRQPPGRGPRRKTNAAESRNAAGTWGAAGTWNGGAPGWRPLRLWSFPVPLRVIAIVPDGPPLRFCLHGQDHRVRRFWGPERIETGWWRHRAVRRDYYRVEDEEGFWFWIYRSLDDGHWFGQGAFD